MEQKVVVRAGGGAGYLGLRLFAGEAITFEVPDRPADARVTVTMGFDTAAPPLVQRSGDERVALSPEDLAPLGEGRAGVYNVWIEQGPGRRLLQHGSIVAQPSLAPVASAAPVAGGAVTLELRVGEAVSVDLSTGFTGTDLMFSLAPGSEPLPVGLALSSEGVLTGQSVMAGQHDLLLRASNAAGWAETELAMALVAAPGGAGGSPGAMTFAAHRAGPRLIVDGDSTMANPGFRDAMLWALGDVTWLPDTYQQATGGHTIQTMLDGAQAVVDLIERNETIVVIGPVGANWDPTDPAAPYTQSKSKMAELIKIYRDAGAVVVCVPALPSGYSDPANPYTAKQEKYDAINATLAEVAAADADVHVVDVSGFDPLSMKNDETHPNIEHGAAYLAGRVREVVVPLISGSRLAEAPNLLGAAGEFPGDAPSAVAGVSGIQPDGWVFTRIGTASWSVARNGAGDLVISCQDAPDRTQLTLRYNADVGGVAGDIFDAIFEVEVDPASTGFGGLMSGVAGSTLLGMNSITPFLTVPSWPLFARSRGYAQEGAHGVRQVSLGLSCVAGGSVTYIMKRAAMLLARNAANALEIAGDPAVTVEVGQPYGFTPLVSGGSVPYGFDLASGSLPPGLSLDPGTGTISGSATSAGHHGGIAIRVTDALGATATLAPFAIEVTAAGVPSNTTPPTLSNTSPAEGETIGVDVGAWSNAPDGFRYQWRHSGNVQAGETGPSHTIAAGVAPQVITCQVWAANAAGESAVAETAPSDPVVAGGVASVTGWDDSGPDWTHFGGVEQLLYADQGRGVAAAPGMDGMRNAVGADALSGRVYFEVELVSGVNLVGIADAQTSIASGSLTADRHGKAGGLVFHSDGNTAIGNALTDGQRACLAVDTEAGLFWIRQEAGAWNEDTAADPAAGTGGFSLAALTPPIRAHVQLKRQSGAEARLHGSRDRWHHAAPAGFGPIA